MRVHQPGWDDELIDDKYRVFYGPGEHHGVSAFYRKVVSPRNPMGTTFQLREVEGFVFVLRPEVDPAARVAIAAYAAAVAPIKPQLAEDLLALLPEWLEAI